MQTTVLQAAGLQTNVNKLSVQAGGLVSATNAVIDRKDVVEIRRGLNPVGSTFNFLGPADTLFDYDGRLISSNGSTLAYDSNNNPSNPSWTPYSGTFSPPETAKKIHTVEGPNSNLYMTTSQGIYKMDSVTSAPYPAGGVAALDGEATVLATGSGFLNNNSNVAYQVVWGYTDANDNLILGVPSEIINATNTSGANQNVEVTFTVPDGLSTTYFWQLYRSAQTNSTSVVAGANFQLVGQRNLTALEISALQVTYDDQTPDDLKGATLYTDPTQQGPTQTNNPPPLCTDLCLWKGMTFYLNCSSPQRMFITLISVGSPNGIQVGDTITVTDGSTTRTYTGDSTQTPSSQLFEVVSTGTVAEQIDATARNIVACINQDPGNTFFYAYYVSGFNQLPGQILLQSRTIGSSEFSITSSRGGAFSPDIPSSGTSYISVSDNFPNGVYVSKSNQPEAVPLVNLYLVGSANHEGFRILALTDAVYVLKGDGVFRITGDTPTNLIVTIAYPDTIITAPESAAILNNSIYAYTNQGIVTINQSEPQLISFPIEDQLNPVAAFDNFQNSYGVSYPADRKYIFMTLTDDDDTIPTQGFVWNYITQAWTNWDVTFTGGFMNSNDQKLYFCSTVEDKVIQERKSYTLLDYADKSVSVSIINYSGVEIELNTVTGIEEGWTFAQTTDNPNFPIKSVITDIDTMSNTITVEDEITWEVGSAAAYEPIDCTVGYSPASGGFPLYLKHWGSLNFDFENLTANLITGQITSDLSNYTESFELMPSFPGYGTVPYGTDTYGGISFSLQPIRVLVPLNKARSHWINISLNANEALTRFILAGTSAEFEITSTRMR